MTHDEAPKPNRLLDDNKRLRYAAVGVTVGALVVSPIRGLFTAQNRTPLPPTPMTSQQYHDALDAELRSVYTSVNVDSAVDTGKSILKDGRREIVAIHIASDVDEAVADDQTTPTYFYGDEPIGTARINGGSLLPGDIEWTDQKAGMANMNVNMLPFSWAQPSVVDYSIALEAYGSDQEQHRLDAMYRAGHVIVSGSKGVITSITIMPRAENEPPVDITTS